MDNVFDINDLELTEERIREIELQKLKSLYEKECHYIELTDDEEEELERLIEKYGNVE
jgi:hypothetical protein